MILNGCSYQSIAVMYAEQLRVLSLLFTCALSSITFCEKSSWVSGRTHALGLRGAVIIEFIQYLPLRESYSMTNPSFFLTSTGQLMFRLVAQFRFTTRLSPLPPAPTPSPHAHYRCPSLLVSQESLASLITNLETSHLLYLFFFFFFPDKISHIHACIPEVAWKDSSNMYKEVELTSHLNLRSNRWRARCLWWKALEQINRRGKKNGRGEKAFYLKTVSLIHRINAYSTAHEGTSVTLFVKCLPH